MLSRSTAAVRISVLLGAFALLGGLLSLLGWALDIPRLTDWFSRGISMQVNTSLAAICAAAGLLSYAGDRRRLTAALGTAVALIGLATLVEHVTLIDLGIDTLLFHRPWGAGATFVPGRMGPPAATSFTLLGSGLFIAALSRRGRSVVAWLGLATVVIALLAFTGYLFSADRLYTLPRLTGISLQTSIILLALGFGLAASQPDQQPVCSLLEDSGAGQMARRALPVILLAPVLMGWVVTRGQAGGAFDPVLGTALLVLSLIVVTFGVLAWGVATVRSREVVARRSERELSDFFDNATVGLHWVGPDGIILRANQADLDLAGVTRERYLGRHIAEFHADAGVIEDILTRLAAGERLRDYPARLKQPDGSTRDVLIDSSVLWEDGRFIHTRCFTRDVTDRKRAEDALRDADRRKDEFLATLSHELRNPLAPIVNSLELIRRADGNPALIAEARCAMDRQVRHLVRLVDDLLDISRITTNRLELRRERTDLASVLRHAVEASRAPIDEARHRLILDLPAEPVLVHADPTRLAQVVSNLLTNAARYTEPGGEIHLSARREGGEVVVTVRDTGIGISREMLPRVFDMFTQVNTAYRGSQGGLGIGLSLVKRLVELHDGSVTPASEGDGRGSTFTVRLPEMAGTEPEPPAPPPPKVTTVPRRILVVDDNVDAAETLAAILKLTGNQVETARDGIEAVEKAGAFRPEAILLDIGLPRLNGHDACLAIRKEPWGKDIMILALTGWGQTADRDKSTRAGFNGHLVKPVDLDQLAALLGETVPAAEPPAREAAR